MEEATSISGDTSPAKLTVIKGPAVSDEVVFYSDDRGVRVTNTRLVVTRPQGTTTYSMANITSVSMSTIPANRTTGIVVGVLGLIISSLGFAFDYYGAVIIGILVLGAGIFLAIAAKPTYTVKVSSASGEEEAIPPSKDREYVHGIVNAMNEAFIKRG